MEEKKEMKVDGNIERFYQYSFPMQAVLVTCHDDEHNKTNVITVAWHTPISVDPPLYGISIAPKRYSHSIIEKSKEFVINFVPYHLVDKTHFCGTHSGRTVNKIKETELTLLSARRVKTPLIKECYAHLECKLFQSLKIGDHTFFVGQILSVEVDKELFKNDLLKIDKIQPLYYIGGNKYTTIDKTKKREF